MAVILFEYSLEFFKDDETDEGVYINTLVDSELYAEVISKEDYLFLLEEQSEDPQTPPPDPLGNILVESLFEVPGVVEVGVDAYRIFISKTPSFPWFSGELKIGVIEQVIDILRQYFGAAASFEFMPSRTLLKQGRKSRRKILGGTSTECCPQSPPSPPPPPPPSPPPPSPPPPGPPGPPPPPPPPPPPSGQGTFTRNISGFIAIGPGQVPYQNFPASSYFNNPISFPYIISSQNIILKRQKESGRPPSPVDNPNSLYSTWSASVTYTIDGSNNLSISSFNMIVNPNPFFGVWPNTSLGDSPASGNFGFWVKSSSTGAQEPYNFLSALRNVNFNISMPNTAPINGTYPQTSQTWSVNGLMQSLNLSTDINYGGFNGPPSNKNQSISGSSPNISATSMIADSTGLKFNFHTTYSVTDAAVNSNGAGGNFNLVFSGSTNPPPP